jgi:hypothetical protein
MTVISLWLCSKKKGKNIISRVNKGYLDSRFDIFTLFTINRHMQYCSCSCPTCPNTFDFKLKNKNCDFIIDIVWQKHRLTDKLTDVDVVYSWCLIASN